MRLKEYLAKYDIDPKDFAERLHITKSYFYQILKGSKPPSKHLALLIELLTGKLVTSESLLRPKPRRKPKDFFHNPEILNTFTQTTQINTLPEINNLKNTLHTQIEINETDNKVANDGSA